MANFVAGLTDALTRRFRRPGVGLPPFRRIWPPDGTVGVKPPALRQPVPGLPRPPGVWPPGGMVGIEPPSLRRPRLPVGVTPAPRPPEPRPGEGLLPDLSSPPEWVGMSPEQWSALPEELRRRLWFALRPRNPMEAGVSEV